MVYHGNEGKFLVLCQELMSSADTIVAAILLVENANCR